MKYDYIKIQNICSLGHFPKESSLYPREIGFSLKNNHGFKEKEFKLLQRMVYTFSSLGNNHVP